MPYCKGKVKQEITHIEKYMRFFIKKKRLVEISNLELQISKSDNKLKNVVIAKDKAMTTFFNLLVAIIHYPLWHVVASPFVIQMESCCRVYSKRDNEIPSE
jgi:hypothetical protein